MGIDDVRIRVHRTGICGTDLHIASWDAWAARTIRPPLVVGHEFVGEVLEIGWNVHDLQPGDLVSGEGHVVCGRCRHCRAGRWNLCANTVGLGRQPRRRVRRAGRPSGHERMASLAGDRRGRRRDLRPVRERGPHGARFPVLGEDVLVVGAGPIGLMAAAVARHAGARFVVVSEPNPFRRELALRMGATHVVDPPERTLAGRPGRARDGRGVRRRPRDVRQRGRPARRAREHGPRRRDGRSSASRPRRSRSTSARSSSTS